MRLGGKRKLTSNLYIVLPTDDSFRIKIAQLKKNQQRRLARKKSMRGELDVYNEGDDHGVSDSPIVRTMNLD